MLIVQARDPNNAPMPDTAVWVIALTPGATVPPNQLNADGLGNTPAFTVRGAYPGPAQFGATVNGVQLQPPVTITFQ